MATWQLGLSTSGVQGRVARGKLHRVHRGVYAVGHPALTLSGRYMAAALACGADAALSHRSAAALWAIRPTSRGRFDVTVPRGSAGPRPAIDVHRGRRFEIVRVDGIPCTTVARTIVDCAEVLPLHSIENMIARAEHLQLFDLRALERELPGRRGAQSVRAALALYRGEAPSKNEMEGRLFRICRGAGLPRPQVNVWIEGAERDFVWVEERVIVETDGRETHDATRAFEEDRRRDQVAAAAGWIVVRFTWRQLVGEPERVAAVIGAVLTQRRVS